MMDNVTLVMTCQDTLTLLRFALGLSAILMTPILALCR